MTSTSLQDINVDAPRRKWPRNSDYKPTDIGWISSIPQNWDSRRTKHLGRAIIGLTYSPQDVCEKDEGTLVLRASNIQDGKIALDDNVYVKTPIPFALRTRENDVLICSRNGSQHLVGKCAMIASEQAGNSFGAFTTVFRSKYNQYLFWVFSSGMMTQQAGMYQTSTIFQLTTGILNEFRVPLPPLDEQRAITAFLDRETVRVDELIEKKLRLMELLSEKRQAAISRVVTKGLDPNALMKPSGIDWLGEIPAHWETKCLRYLFDNLNHRRIPLSGEERSYRAKIYPYYGASGVIDAVDEYIFDESLILVAEDGANLLSRSTPLAFVAEGQYWVNNHAHIIRPRRGPIRYWEAVLQSFDFTPLVSGSAQPKLTIGRLNTVTLPVPPIEEQEDIADAIADACGTLDSVAGAIATAIDRIRQYRSALITAAVTGQIDVRNCFDEVS